MMLVSISAFSQIQVLETKESVKIGEVNGYRFVASLEYTKGDADMNFYTLMYRNFEYNSITDIKYVCFESTEEELNGFYDLIKNRFSEIKDAEKKVMLGKALVSIHTSKPNNYLSIWVAESDNGIGYFQITKKQLDILFGKLVKK